MMPMKPDAKCPRCSTPLLAIVDQRTPNGVLSREYFHKRTPDQERRRRPCMHVFYSRDEAAAERAVLELRPIDPQADRKARPALYQSAEYYRGLE